VNLQLVSPLHDYLNLNTPRVALMYLDLIQDEVYKECSGFICNELCFFFFQDENMFLSLCPLRISLPQLQMSHLEVQHNSDEKWVHVMPR
jgi:hypothetical protein